MSLVIQKGSLVQLFQYMFRGEADGFAFPVLSPLHMLFIFLTIFLLVGIVALRSYMDAHPRTQRAIEIALGVVLLSIQGVYYFWYVYSGTYTLSASLPLYTCRAASFIGPLALFTRNRVLKIISIYWGFYAFFALLSPSLDAFSFPHITNFIFWSAHICLVCMCAVQIFWGEGYDFDASEFKAMMVFMAVYLVISYPIDMGLQGNYHFFVQAPLAADLLAKLPHYLYFMVVISMYLLITYITYVLGSAVVRLVHAQEEKEKVSYRFHRCDK